MQGPCLGLNVIPGLRWPGIGGAAQVRGGLSLHRSGRVNRIGRLRVPDGAGSEPQNHEREAEERGHHPPQVSGPFPCRRLLRDARCFIGEDKGSFCGVFFSASDGPEGCSVRFVCARNVRRTERFAPIRQALGAVLGPQRQAVVDRRQPPGIGARDLLREWQVLVVQHPIRCARDRTLRQHLV